MYILSEYYLSAGNSESHYVWVYNNRNMAKNAFRHCAEETKKIFPDLDVEEHESRTNAHWEGVREEGMIDVYDLMLIEVAGTFVESD